MREVKHKFARNAGGNAKYDWEQILNGKTWELIQGEDFEMEPRTFVAHCHGTAKRRNLKVRTHTDLSKKAVIVRAYDDNDPKERKMVGLTLAKTSN
tara:strand:- start:1912 stop:2199 length:288 start_codon:yes stop_codon:yes gene_type:complete